MENQKENLEQLSLDSALPERKLEISDAKVLLNSGKMGFVFIGVIATFFLLVLSLSLFRLSNLAVFIICGILLAALFVFYLQMHKDDESKLN